MKTVVLNTSEAPNKWWAAIDAAIRNSVNKSHYSDKERLRFEHQVCYISINRRALRA